MESVTKRRCANGQSCYHVRELGLKEPVALRPSYKGAVCEKCRGAAEVNLGVPNSEEHQYRTNGTRLLSTRAASDLRLLKQDLVLGLFMRRGAFWEAIKELRSRRGIKAVSGLPRGGRIFPFIPLPPDAGAAAQSPDYSMNTSEYLKGDKYERWTDDLISIIYKVIPERFYPRYASTSSLSKWYGFIAACVLYNPPAGQLPEFADMGGPWASGLVRWRGDEEPSSSTYVMEVSPVRRIFDPVETKRIEAKYWTTVLQKLHEMHLRPRGLDIDSLLEDVDDQFPEIKRTKQQEMDRLKRGHFIEVDEYTTEEDVRNAFRVLSEAHRARPKTGRPSRNRLICVEAAILHDEHEFTYEQLAERYGWKDPTLASKYVKDGRTILNE